MRKALLTFIALLSIVGCRGTTKPAAPFLFPPAAENRLRYRFAVPPPTSIEKAPLTLYTRKVHVQKRIVRAIDAYSRFSTCITIPKRESGTLEAEIKYARKREADFLLRTDILRFEASYKGRNARAIFSYLIILPPASWDVSGKTWLGEGIMDIKVIDCSSGKQIYSSIVKTDALHNFSLNDELNEMQMGKNFIRYTLGGIVLNNLMVGLVEDLNLNFTKSLVEHGEEAPDETPTPEPQQKEPPDDTPTPVPQKEESLSVN